MRCKRTLLAAVLLCLCLAPVTRGVELRIETRVFSAEQDEPVCESTTLFSAGAVYDFRKDRPTVTIFRPGTGGKPGRFVLLDTQRKVRTEITTDKVDHAMASLREWASQSRDPFLRFTSSPTFTESYSAETGELELVGEQLTYRLVTVPLEHPEARVAVRTFLDGFTKLQTLLETSLPPDPRLRVNEALFLHKVLPVETRLYSRDQEKPSLRAEHLMAWLVSKPDKQRIDEALDQLASFREVTNKEYRRGRRQVAAR